MTESEPPRRDGGHEPGHVPSPAASGGETARTPSRPGPVAALLLAAIRLYQLTLSAFIGRHCRHLPTCSEYAMEAICLHGAWAGFWLGFFRVMRCHPLGTHGLDPVPRRGVTRHDPLFWRYARHGRCPKSGEDGGEQGA